MHLPRCLSNGAACRSCSQATRRKGRRASGMPTTRKIIDAGLTMDADTRCLRGWMNTRPGWLTWWVSDSRYIELIQFHLQFPFQYREQILNFRNRGTYISRYACASYVCEKLVVDSLLNSGSIHNIFEMQGRISYFFRTSTLEIYLLLSNWFWS
jgi:hypothetical protein